MFNTIDTDGNGYLTGIEVYNYFVTYQNYSYNYPDMVKQLDWMDSTNDGFIDLDDYCLFHQVTHNSLFTILHE